MKNYVQSGKTIAYTNSTEAVIASGDVVIIGSVAGIAVADIAVDGIGSVDISQSVFRLAKTTSLVITQGDELFWNTGTKKVTKTATDKPLGIAFTSQLSADVLVDVKMYGQGNGVPVAAVVAALTDNTGGTANSTLAIIPAGTPADLAAQGVINATIADGLADLAANNNAILTALKSAGIMASA